MRPTPSIAIFAALALIHSAYAVDDSLKMPDGLLLKDGRRVHGLILKNTRDSVTIQEKDKENTYAKKDIVRIYDEPNKNGMAFTLCTAPGKLPPWQVVANDLRTNDSIKSLVEIPPTAIDNGVFKNVPYKSFRVNGNVEMNIYGNADDPAGIEMGIYGSASRNNRLKRVLRSYFAGFLTTRQEVATLYALSFAGGLKEAGDLTFEITPRNAPDAYGAWWISLYNTKKLNAARVSDAAYAKLVRPVDEIVDKDGHIIIPGWKDGKLNIQSFVAGATHSAQAILFGFYRDEEGDLRVLTR